MDSFSAIANLNNDFVLYDGNFWNRPRILPKVIIGFKMITGGFGIPSKLEFDWHPAKEPYDIPQIAI